VSCGKPVGVEAQNISPDAELIVGGKDVRVDHAIQEYEYMTGRCFSGSGSFTLAESGSSSSSTVLRNSGIATKQYVPLRPKNSTGYKAPSFVRTAATASAEPSNALSPAEAARVSTLSASMRPKTDDVAGGKPTYWCVNWRKPQQKKHKTWDGDAYLMHKGDRLTLVTEKGLM
jgi:DNA repair and recombination protein RAD54B